MKEFIQLLRFQQKMSIRLVHLSDPINPQPELKLGSLKRMLEKSPIVKPQLNESCKIQKKNNFHNSAKMKQQPKSGLQLKIQKSVNKCKTLNMSDFKKKITKVYQEKNFNKPFLDNDCNDSNLYRIVAQLKDICSGIKQIYTQMKQLFNFSKNLWELEFKKLQEGCAMSQSIVIEKISRCYTTLQKNIQSLNSPPTARKSKKSKSFQSQISKRTYQAESETKFENDSCSTNMQLPISSSQVPKGYNTVNKLQFLVNDEITEYLESSSYISIHQEQYQNKEIENISIHSHHPHNRCSSGRIKTQMSDINNLLVKIKQLTEGSDDE